MWSLWAGSAHPRRCGKPSCELNASRSSPTGFSTPPAGPTDLFAIRARNPPPSLGPRNAPTRLTPAHPVAPPSAPGTRTPAGRRCRRCLRRPQVAIGASHWGLSSSAACISHPDGARPRRPKKVSLGLETSAYLGGSLARISHRVAGYIVKDLLFSVPYWPCFEGWRGVKCPE